MSQPGVVAVTFWMVNVVVISGVDSGLSIINNFTQIGSVQLIELDVAVLFECYKLCQ
jgi:hypothetical protein